MELVWHSKGNLHRMGPCGLIVTLCLLFLLAAATVFAVVPAASGSNAPPEQAAQVDKAADARRLQQLIIATDAEMAALAAQLGDLQGRLTRLESVGQQVGELAGFEPEILAFDQPVALGGPVNDDAPLKLQELMAELRQFAARLEDRSVRLDLLDEALLTQLTETQRLPTGRPTRSGWLSSNYGYRTHPLTGRRHFHHGVDLAGKAGDVVEVVASGLVTWAGKKGGYGNLLEVDHRNGYITRYGHNDKLLVKVGELVKQGQVIATMGSTGRSTGPHVHFEVLKDGKSINPHKYLKGRRVAHLSN